MDDTATSPSARPVEEHPSGPARPPHTRRGAFRLGALAGLSLAAMVVVDREGGGGTPCQITVYGCNGPGCWCSCSCHDKPPGFIRDGAQA